MKYLVLLLSLAMAATDANLHRFPLEPTYEDVEYDPESAMEERAVAAIRACRGFNNIIRPEYHEFVWDLSALPDSGEANVVDRVRPEFQVCSPPFSWPKPWKKFINKINEVVPEEKKKDKKNKDDADKAAMKKQLMNRKKVIAVTHPLTRLAKAFLEVVKDSTGPKFETVKKVFASGNSRLTFKDFVHYLTRSGYELTSDEPNEDLAKVVTDAEFNRPWAPYYQSCPVCHPDIFPSYVIKADGDHVEEDLEFVQEMFGLEEVEFPDYLSSEVSDTALKTLYSQLSRDELDNLVDFYHVDLKTYRYDTQKFYDMIKA